MPERARAVVVGERRPDEPGDEARDGLGLLGRRLAVMEVSDGEPLRPVPRRERPCRRDRRRPQPARVVRVGGEVAQLGPQPPGLREEEPAVGRDRDVVAEEVLQDRAPESSGCVPCETCGSWFGSPSRMSERALVPAARTSASES